MHPSPIARAVARGLLGAALVLASACVGLAGPAGAPDPLAGARPMGESPRAADHREGFQRKVVAEKRGETLLIAHDLTTCQVTPEQFREIEVGDERWCHWRIARASWTSALSG